jgi:NitT/TauT family transport system permease protein
MAQLIAPVTTADVALASTTPTKIRIRRLLRSGRPYYVALGICIFFAAWYLLVDVFKIWRFRELPGLVPSVKEWLSPDPIYGMSLFTAEYYSHIWASLYRVFTAFISATILGITIGVLMGWSRIFRGLTFPILEMLRPIPILAWIPLAILLVPGREAPIIVLTFLAAFFVTILNTLLGVRSIDQVYFRAARSLGFSNAAILLHVVLPGALPYIFVGLQIAMGACWFSLVAAEIVSGQAGLGYKVWETYYYVQYETMVMVMATLGLLGYLSSALVRAVGNRLMRWRARLLAGA